MITHLIYLAGGDEDDWWDVEIGICD
jgi:hypothetical protein